MNDALCFIIFNWVCVPLFLHLCTYSLWQDGIATGHDGLVLTHPNYSSIPLATRHTRKMRQKMRDIALVQKVISDMMPRELMINTKRTSERRCVCVALGLGTRAAKWHCIPWLRRSDV